MKPILFSLVDNGELLTDLAKETNYEIGEIILRSFPDEEIYIKINSEIKNRNIIFIESLERPNYKIVPLLFAAKTARDLGAKKIGIVAPYLAYMRQDKRFSSGEGITSKYFAELLSSYFDWLITIDPHLHRYHNLNEIYSIKTLVLHASDSIATWIKTNIFNPVLIGPDQESKQWVADIAQKADVPFIVLEKIRKADQLVEVSLPQLEKYKNNTPVLIDDIISTAKTMIATVKHLKNTELPLPVCIGIHAVFSGNAYEDLLQAGVQKVVTCNTIKHVSNEIDLGPLIINAIRTNVF